MGIFCVRIPVSNLGSCHIIILLHQYVFYEKMLAACYFVLLQLPLQFGFVSIYLKALRIVRVGQGNITGVGCLYVVKCLLVNHIPMPQPLFCVIGPCGFGVSSLTNQIGWWSQHFTLTCPDVSVMLNHAQIPTELFNSLWQCYCKDCLYQFKLNYVA